MRPSRIFALALAIALTAAFLCGCGNHGGTPTETEATSPSVGGTTAPPPIITEPPQTEPASTEPPPPPPGPVNRIDDSQLSKNNLSVQQIFVCDDDTVLFFVSPVNHDGTVSESIIVYSYSFKLGGFRAATYYAGTVNLFPSCVFDDGTVAIVTLDSESYDFDSLIFLDTMTLRAEKHPLPDEDFYDLHISPDKRYAAISTYDYLLVTDLMYTEEYLRLERYPAAADYSDDQDEEWPDELVPSATGWSADSDVLYFKTIGWSGADSPGLIRAGIWEAQFLNGLYGNIVVPIGNQGFYYEAFVSQPAGTVNPADNAVSPPVFYAGDGPYNGITADSSGRYVCLLSMAEGPGNNEYQCAATVSSIDGEYINSFEITRTGDIVSFEQAFFTPSGERLVLVASGTLNYSRAVYTFDFLMK